jgi:hypothetical protein
MKVLEKVFSLHLKMENCLTSVLSLHIPNGKCIRIPVMSKKATGLM